MLEQLVAELGAVGGASVIQQLQQDLPKKRVLTSSPRKWNPCRRPKGMSADGEWEHSRLRWLLGKVNFPEVDEVKLEEQICTVCKPSVA